MLQIAEPNEAARAEACALIAHRLAMQIIAAGAQRPAGAEPAWYTRRFAPARRAEPKGGVSLSGIASTPAQKIHCLARTARISESDFDLFWQGYDCELPENA